MNLVGLMLVRNSDWVIGLSLRAALMYCDSVIVLMHRCEDKTEDIVMDIARETKRVVVLVDNSEEWEEMRLRQNMLETARLLKATHIFTIDDDEVLTGNLVPDIRRHVEQTPAGQILFLPWIQLAGGPLYVSSGMWSRQMVTVAFQDFPYFKWEARDGYDFHHRHPMGKMFEPYCPFPDRKQGLMHLQFVSGRRLLAKQFLYQLTEVKRWPGRTPLSKVVEMYSETVREFESAEKTGMAGDWIPPLWGKTNILRIWLLQSDAEPWQERECKRLLLENPGIEEGLNDFGLMKKWGLK